MVGEEDEDAHRRMLAALRGGKKGPHRAVVVSEAQDEDAYNLNPETSTAGPTDADVPCRFSRGAPKSPWLNRPELFFSLPSLFAFLRHR